MQYCMTKIAIKLRTFLIYWDTEDSLTAVSQHSFDGGTNVGDTIHVKGMSSKYTGRICAMGKYSI